MSNLFVISDTHFGHEKCITQFKRPDGSPLRDFANVEEMDQVMIDRWNAIVKPTDKVYHLGDVAISRRFLSRVFALNGKKKLLLGNHDIFKIREYLDLFYDIASYKVWDRVLFSHIPLHEGTLEHRFSANVHGHIHANVLDDPRYINVSVEVIDYTPVSVEAIRDTLKHRGIL